MNKDLTEIVVILDKSGSMAAIKDEAISGFNQFIDNQRKQPGEAHITLALFDTEYKLVYDDEDIKEVEALTDKAYIPGGCTALYDAMGTTILHVGRRLADTDEDVRPGKVIVVTISDGEENSSKECTAETIKNMVELQKDVYSWEFVYLGANQDAMLNAQRMGINHSSNYTASAQGMSSTWCCMDAAISNYRDTGKVKIAKNIPVNDEK
jgi:hypothetical protein